jgi:TctA family transporter
MPLVEENVRENKKGDRVKEDILSSKVFLIWVLFSIGQTHHGISQSIEKEHGSRFYPYLIGSSP